MASLQRTTGSQLTRWGILFPILLAMVITAGTIGYHLLAGLSLPDSFYLTIIMISTVAQAGSRRQIEHLRGIAVPGAGRREAAGPDRAP